jgi:hypothetical protein
MMNTLSLCKRLRSLGWLGLGSNTSGQPGKMIDSISTRRVIAKILRFQGSAESVFKICIRICL